MIIRLYTVHLRQFTDNTMCVNFTTPSQQQLKSHFKAPISDDVHWKSEVWQDYAAPIVVGEGGEREALVGLYSMIPKMHLPPNAKRYSTMNARVETVGTLRSYSKEWKGGQLCLVPMTAFFEPNYESGKAERWKIGMADESPFAVAGLYRKWVTSDGAVTFSFTQLTINADNHSLMRMFHKPDDEKRSLVIVPEDRYDDWLTCRDPEKAKSFLNQYPAEKMIAFEAKKEMVLKPKAATNLDLFS